MIGNHRDTDDRFFKQLHTSPIRLIAIDIDGTLLDSQHELRTEVITTIGQVVEQGFKVSLVSGRPRCAILKYLQSLSLNAPDVTSGGAFIYDPRTDRAVLYQPLLPDATKAVVETARKAGVDIFFGSPDTIHYEAQSDFLEREHGVADEHLRHTNDILQSTDLRPGKIMLVGEQGIITKLEYSLRMLNQPVHITYSGASLLEITHINVNKGTALQHLAGYLNISLEMVLAIGDSPNDISMFDAAGFSIAMGNAHDEVKQHANYVAPTNDDEGLAWILRRLL